MIFGPWITLIDKSRAYHQLLHCTHIRLHPLTVTTTVTGSSSAARHTEWIQPIETLITRFMGPTWSPSGADRTQIGPMLAPWNLLSGEGCVKSIINQPNLEYDYTDYMKHYTVLMKHYTVSSQYVISSWIYIYMKNTYLASETIWYTASPCTFHSH